MEMFNRSSNSSNICIAWMEFNRMSSKLACISIDSGGTPIICDNSSRQNEINSCSDMNFSITTKLIEWKVQNRN